MGVDIGYWNIGQLRSFAQYHSTTGPLLPCNCIVTRGGLRQYFIVYPDSSHNTVILNYLTTECNVPYKSCIGPYKTHIHRHLHSLLQPLWARHLPQVVVLAVLVVLLAVAVVVLLIVVVLVMLVLAPQIAARKILCNQWSLWVSWDPQNLPLNRNCVMMIRPSWLPLNRYYVMIMMLINMFIQCVFDVIYWIFSGHLLTNHMYFLVRKNAKASWGSPIQENRLNFSMLDHILLQNNNCFLWECRKVSWLVFYPFLIIAFS